MPTPPTAMAVIMTLSTVKSRNWKSRTMTSKSVTPPRCSRKPKMIPKTRADPRSSGPVRKAREGDMGAGLGWVQPWWARPYRSFAVRMPAANMTMKKSQPLTASCRQPLMPWPLVQPSARRAP